jgi:hypothetical protein
MAIQVKSLACTTLQTSEGELYVLPANKAAVVKNIRLLNTTGSQVTVNLYIKRGAAGTSFRITKASEPIAANTLWVDDKEVTLEYVNPNADRITGWASATGVDCVINGIERDA